MMVWTKFRPLMCAVSLGAQETVVRLMPHYFCTGHRLHFPSPPPGLHLILFQLPFLCICFHTTFLLFLFILSERMIGFMDQSQPYGPVHPRAVHQRVARTLAGSSMSDAPLCQEGHQGRNRSQDASQGKQSAKEGTSCSQGENSPPSPTRGGVRVADW